MKSFIALGSLLIAATASADQWEQAITGALSPLRISNGLIFHLEGNEFIGGKYAPIQCDLFYSSQLVNDKPQIQIELTTFINNKLADRIVADGTTLWVYNNRTFEYSATTYGAYDGKLVPNYQKNLLNAIHASARGFATYPARLLKEVMGGTATEYRSWMPGAAGYTISNPSSYRDPVYTDRVYAPVLANEVWLFVAGARRSLAITVDTNSTTTATQIQYAESFKSGQTARISEWSMRIFRDARLDAADFKPYSTNDVKGWRAVPGVRPASG